MKTNNWKFMSMAAIAAMTILTACSNDETNPNPNPEPNPEPTPSVDGYSSDLFLAEGNHNTINFDFGSTLTNVFVGTIQGGADMPTVDSFFASAAYQGAVPADNNWTAGWTLTNEAGGDNKPGMAYTGTLPENLTADMTLEAGSKWLLDGVCNVESGATLTIEEGVTILAKDDSESTTSTVDYILVKQGGKIVANGTAENPIVMTAEAASFDANGKGAWGGLHICGYAHTNGGQGLSEIGGAPYGGDNDTDNSGVLRYVRLEYTGYAFDEEHEGNGISFYGVGNGTTVEYVQVYRGSDDGFEWFGGSADAKYLVSTNCSDDSFDWTEGWNGRGQFFVAYQDANVGYDCDCLMECDNNGDNFAATPVSHPVLANLTLVGNNSADATRGIRLRAGTQVEIYNALVLGKEQCLTTETAETEDALVDGTSVLNYITLATDITCEGAGE